MENESLPLTSGMDTQVSIKETYLRLVDKDAVKSSVPLAIAWLEFSFEGKEFMFCTSRHPSYSAGVSTTVIKGWVFLDYDDRWQPLLEALTHEIGDGKLSFDKDTGVLLLQGTANNRLNGMHVLSFNLKTAER